MEIWLKNILPFQMTYIVVKICLYDSFKSNLIYFNVKLQNNILRINIYFKNYVFACLYEVVSSHAAQIEIVKAEISLFF